MILEINSDKLCVGINSLGAELAYLNIKGINILWQKNSLWSEQSPILFPNIGSFKDSKYIYLDKTYEAFVHGFAKRSEFIVVDKRKDEITLLLSNNKFSYPFNFNLFINYKIVNDILSINFKVTNLSSNVMYFALGFHPGYDYFGLNKLLGDNCLEIKKENYESIDFTGSYVSGKHKEKLEIMPFSKMSKMLIEPRTLCYKDLNEIGIIGKTSKILIKHDMPYTAFWQKIPETDPKFLCIESWYGLPDILDADLDLSQKETLISLNPNSNFVTKYIIQYIE